MKNLENVVGLQEMSLQEMENVNGGAWFTITALCVAGAYAYCCALEGAFEAGRQAMR